MKDFDMRNIKQFITERDEAMKSYDVQKFRDFFVKWTFKGAYDMPLPTNDKVIEVMMRKCVYHMKSSTIKERLEAKRWLEDHGCTTELG